MGNAVPGSINGKTTTKEKDKTQETARQELGKKTRLRQEKR